MKIIIISDTHNKHRQLKPLPEGDILIHCGDFTMIGYQKEVEDFLGWFNSQPHKHKIFIAGNHDKSFDPKYNTLPDPFWDENGERVKQKPIWLKNILAGLDQYNVHYLENSEVTIDNIKFWGSPITPWFGGDRWAFNKHRGEDIKQIWDNIPEKTDVIITHGPIFGMHDWTLRDGRNVGCEDLKRKLDIIKPKLHCCGHIHESYGLYPYGETTYVNASVVDLYYDVKNEPIVIDL